MLSTLLDRLDDRSLLLVRYHPDKQLGAGKEIHVWWGGLAGNGGLMLLLAFLITAHYRWRNARITVLTVVEKDEERRSANENLKKLLESARMLNDRMRQVRDSGKVFGADRMAVITALNIIHELTQQDREREAELERASVEVQRLAEKAKLATGRRAATSEVD